MTPESVIAQAWPDIVISPTLIARFWQYVDQADPDGCWPWMGNPSQRGYGTISVGYRKADHVFIPVYAHRLSWLINCGPIPDGLEVCHTCDNPICVRPSHFFLGTAKDNAADCVAKNRQSRRGGCVLSDSERDEIRRLYANTRVRPQEIADRFGVSIGYVFQLASRDGIKREHSGGPKLSRQDADDIRQRYAAGGIRMIDLAEQYDTSVGNISHIVNGKRHSGASSPALAGATAATNVMSDSI